MVPHNVLATSNKILQYFKETEDPPRRTSNLSKKARAKLKREAKPLKTTAFKDKQVVRGKRHTRKVRVDDPVMAQAKRAVFLHRKTMERLIRSVRMDSSGQQSIIEAIGKLQETSCALKAKYQVCSGPSRKALRSAQLNEVVTDAKTSRYQKKVYVSKEQRAINKDNIARAQGKTVSPETFKATRLQVVGGTEHVVAKPKVYGYKANPTPSSRKERMKLAKDLKKFFKKAKYSPYNRKTEVLSKQAA